MYPLWKQMVLLNDLKIFGIVRIEDVPSAMVLLYVENKTTVISTVITKYLVLIFEKYSN